MQFIENDLPSTSRDARGSKRKKIVGVYSDDEDIFSVTHSFDL